MRQSRVGGRSTRLWGAQWRRNAPSTRGKQKSMAERAKEGKTELVWQSRVGGGSTGAGEHCGGERIVDNE